MKLSNRQSWGKNTHPRKSKIFRRWRRKKEDDDKEKKDDKKYDSTAVETPTSGKEDKKKETNDPNDAFSNVYSTYHKRRTERQKSVSLTKDLELEMEDDFYANRGLSLKGVEVRSVVCKDQRTQDVLQNIIQEQTHRINSLQKQDTQNEVHLKEIRGKIDSQRLEVMLIDQQKEQHEKEGEMKGLSEAARLKSFLSGLQDVVPDVSERINLFNILRKSECLQALSQGEGVNMFFTPSDVDLKISTGPPIRPKLLQQHMQQQMQQMQQPQPMQ